MKEADKIYKVIYKIFSKRGKIMSLNTRLKHIILDLEELENDCPDSRDMYDLGRIVYKLQEIILSE